MYSDVSLEISQVIINDFLSLFCYETSMIMSYFSYDSVLVYKKGQFTEKIIKGKHNIYNFLSELKPFKLKVSSCSCSDFLVDNDDNVIVTIITGEINDINESKSQMFHIVLHTSFNKKYTYKFSIKNMNFTVF